jgi:hypothetical protein
LDAVPVASVGANVDVKFDGAGGVLDGVWWGGVVSQEKLKPVETDLRRIEEMVADIVTEMEYLRAREQPQFDVPEVSPQVNNLPSTKPDKHTHGAKSEPLHACGWRWKWLLTIWFLQI